MELHDDASESNPHSGERDNASVSVEFLKNLIERAKGLLAELELFSARLRALRQEGSVELAHFRGTVQSELSMLERLSVKTEAVGTNHVARSSNLPFLETVWNTAKLSRNLVALQKRLYLDSGTKALSQGMRHVNLGANAGHGKAKGRKHDAVIVDAITDGGRTWAKVSLITNTRLLFDLAKQGWESCGSEGEESDDELAQARYGKEDDNDDDRDVPLLKTAKELARASRLFRVRTKHPTVHMILPRIEVGQTEAVDAVLNNCREVGVKLLCGKDLRPLPSLEDSTKSMIPDPLEAFSKTLNIDCTILLALVSDFSHAKVSKEPWFHKALQRQVEIEGNENLLPSLLYPAMGDRALVCTEEAARRMHEIVDTIGTPSEKARTVILMGTEKTETQAELIEDMQNWSAYPVPSDWHIPIRVVQYDEQESEFSLPPQSKDATAGMTSINKSVFSYGWAHGLTTITSNRTVVKQIENDLERYIDLDDGVWPKIWLCPTARSLVGKEKRGVRSESKKEGVAWPLPDPLRREEQRRNGLDVLSTREGHEVEDFRPRGYPCDEVLEAKNASQRDM